MKTKILLIIFILSVICNIQAQNNPKDVSAHDKKMEWWREARFGMFIHWGPYSVLGGEYNGHKQINGGAEWIMNRSKIPVAEYQAYAKQFNPVKYDPEAWVKLAQEAGMKYIIMTSKHHDGFAMFKSNASNFNIVDFTPYKKDVLDGLAKACRKYNMKLGFYYSQAQDWNNPGGAAARKIASEGWLNPDSAKIDAYTELHNGHWDPVQDSRTMEQYIDQVSIPQVKELLTNYGDVAVIWWDTPTGMTDEFAEKLKAEVDKYPNIITDDRLKRPNFRGDFRTPEQKILGSDELDGSDWETCMTMNDSWGFRKNSDNWKSTETLIRNLIDIASKGGNYLLNVGPTPEGEIPPQSVERLKEVGKWMKVNGEAIYGTTRCFLEKPEWGCYTMKNVKENTVLYLSVFDFPADRQILVPGLKSLVKSCKLLAGKSNLKTKPANEGLIIYLPEKAPDAIASVIRIELQGKLENPVANHIKKNVEPQQMNLTSWTKDVDPETIGKLVAKRFVESRHNSFRANEPAKSITYPEVCAWYGALKFGEATNDNKLLKQLEDRFMPFFGEEQSLVPNPVHVDNTVFGAIPLKLSSINKDEKRFYDMGTAFADAQWTLPANSPEDKKVEYKKLLDNGLTWQTRYWIDDMYMITLVQTEASRTTGDPKYIDRAAHEMVVYLDTLQRPDGLFYHAPDVPYFWGRGNGWMAAGMTELLSSLPENQKDRAAIMQGYLRMMKTLKEFQRPDGLWGQLVDDPYSWSETSCSGMFAYAMTVGVKKGWLSANEYIPVIRKAWTGLLKYINSDGDISNVCEGTNKKNDYRYYIERQQKTGDMHGQAPILWTAAALLKSPQWTLSSPDNEVGITVINKNTASEGDKLFYKVNRNGKEMVQTSPIGIDRSDEQFSSNLTLDSVSAIRLIDETYTLKSGKRLECRNHCNEQILYFKNEKGSAIQLIIRAYNEGVAFRYYFPEHSDKTYKITEEKTGFAIPKDGKAWIHPYDWNSRIKPCYEQYCQNDIPVGTESPNEKGWAYPMLFNVNDNWMMITEAALDGTYCATHLHNAKDGLYTVSFAEKEEVVLPDDPEPVSTLPWTTPWRVIITGSDLASIVESNLVQNLNKPCVIADTSWIKPGRSSWSWWSDGQTTRDYDMQINYVNMTANMGWEYTLIDAGWGNMKNGTVEQIAKYAKDKNVDVWLWYSSGAGHSQDTISINNLMSVKEARRNELAKIRSWGIKGIKVDYFDTDKQNVVKLYEEILKDAADFHIMVDFHGCTLPRGMERTYPNLLTMEGIKGAEGFGQQPACDKAAEHNATVPFTRNVVGSMDYTPVTFSNKIRQGVEAFNKTTYAHQLALSVVFESGFQCFADNYKSYESLPVAPKNFLKNVPVVWDETKLVAGYPGDFVVMARRHGNTWYIGGINGKNEARTISFTLPFIGSSKKINLITDGKTRTEFSGMKISNNGTIRIKLLPNGGFAGIIPQ